MIITKDDPGTRHMKVMKAGKPVGLVQEVDTDTKMMKRLDPDEVFKHLSEPDAPEPSTIIEEPYDELVNEIVTEEGFEPSR